MNPATLIKITEYDNRNKNNFLQPFLLFYSILSTLRQITLETVGWIIMHGNLFSKTIIYERILGKIASVYIT